MGGVSPETCWAIKKHWNNKFYYTVASCWFFLWDLTLFLSHFSGSISSGVIWIFHEYNPYGRIMTLGSTPSVIQISTRAVVYSGGTGGRCLGLTTLPPSCADFLKVLGAPTSWPPKGLSRPVMGLLCLYQIMCLISGSEISLSTSVLVLHFSPTQTISGCVDEVFGFLVVMFLPSLPKGSHRLLYRSTCLHNPNTSSTNSLRAWRCR